MTAPLDPTHLANLGMMLRSLELTPTSPAGLLGSGMLSVPSRPMTPEGALQDASTFPEQAYGATLGLVYYRALGDPLRAAWNAAVDRRITETRAAMSNHMDTARQAYIDAMRSGARKAPPVQVNESVIAQVLRQKLDFLVSIQQKRQAVFPNTASLNDPLILGQYPWCQSDSEFRQAVGLEIGATTPAAHPSFNYGMDGEGREQTSAEIVSKMFHTALTAKVTEYIAKFLEIGEKHIEGMLFSGMKQVAHYLVHKVPIADLIVDYITDLMQDRAQGRLVQAYRTDRQRRLWLAALGWGVYRDPDAASRPGAADFQKQVVGGGP